MRKILASISLALSIFGASVSAQAQSSNPFIPDFAFCSNPGAIVYRSATRWQCLTGGSDGQVIMRSGGFPSWATVTGTGTVTSVALSLPSFITVTGSPVTAAGTLTGTLASQTANTVFAAPNAAAGAPTFRTLVAADLGNSIVAPAATALSLGAAGSAQWTITTGNFLNPATNNTVGIGSASFNLSQVNTRSVISGATLQLKSAAASGIDFMPNGGGSTLWYVAADGTLVPNSALNIGTSGSRWGTAFITTLNVTNAITPAQGGTNITSYSNGDMIYATGATTLSKLAAGTTGQVLQQGASSVPAWSTLPNSTPSGRCTLSSGTPVMTSTVSGATTIYYTPYSGNSVPIWNGSIYVPTVFSELSQATTDATKSPAAVTTNANYDVFVWSDAGTLRSTRGPAWASDTSRGTGVGTSELELIQGVWRNKNAITNGPGAGAGTYVCSVRSNGTSTIDFTYGGASAGGTAASFGVWNYYNRVLISTSVVDTTVSWTYNVATWRASNNSSTKRISTIVGMSEDAHDFSYSQLNACVAGFSCYSGIGVNSTSAIPANQMTGINTTSSAANMTTFAKPQAALGWNYYQALEYGNASGTNTFFGASGQSTSVFMGTLRM